MTEIEHCYPIGLSKELKLIGLGEPKIKEGKELIQKSITQL
jgi:hypothetical protein